MKYDEETTKKICQYIRVGNNYEDAAGLADIDERTLYRWKNKYPSFVTRLKRAEQESKAHDIAVIKKAGERQWQAAAWMLERKYHKEYALKTVMEHTGNSNEPLVIKIISSAEKLQIDNGDRTRNRELPETTGDIQLPGEIHDSSQGPEVRVDQGSSQ